MSELLNSLLFITAFFWLPYDVESGRIALGLVICAHVINFLYERHLQKIRDSVAIAMLGDFDFTKEEKKVKSILDKYDFGRGRRILSNELEKEMKSNPQYCPKCKAITLREINGKWGPFLGCRNYPSCKFTRTFQ